MAVGWHEARFEERPGALRYDCVSCGRAMWFPPSKHGKYQCCGRECSKNHEKALREKRTTPCKTCGKSFIPRSYQLKTGCGVFCSQKCNRNSHIAMNSKEAKQKAVATFLNSIASGKYVPPKGESNPNWKGGEEARRKRRIASGASASTTRKYRAANKEKIKEFSMRRKSRKYGRLPKGTVARIGESQKWKCVVCRVSIKNKYHVDHIVPLALGGAHSPTNIQLLCPSCNVRKSAKHPIDFMQEKGFLL